jgi:hypothetical protein
VRSRIVLVKQFVDVVYILLVMGHGNKLLRCLFKFFYELYSGMVEQIFVFEVFDYACDAFWSLRVVALTAVKKSQRIIKDSCLGRFHTMIKII